MKIVEKEFNTDRPYAEDGQLIKWKMTDSEFDESFESYFSTVVFHDTTRGIIGKVCMLCDRADTDKFVADALLDLYDNGKYKNISLEEYENASVSA